MLGFSLKEILVGLFIAPKMSKYQDCLSIGDIIGKKYGVHAKIITGILSVLVCAGILGIQIGAIANILDELFNVHTLWMTLGVFGVVILYSATGGMRAVVFTDVFQFIVLILGITVTFTLGLHTLGGFESVSESLPSNLIHFESGKDYLLLFVASFLTFLVGEAFIPPYVQRLLLSTNSTKVKQATVWSGIAFIPISIITGCIGLIALALNQNINPNEALPYVINQVLPVGFKGFVISGLFAIIISTTSSFLNAASVAAINDVAKPLVKTNLSERAWLRLAKFSTFVIGFFSVFFTLSIKNLWDILVYAYQFWAPMLLIPMLLIFLDKKVYKYDFFSSFGGGFVSLLLSSFVLQNSSGILSKLGGVMLGVLCSLLSWCTCRVFVWITKKEENQTLSS